MSRNIAAMLDEHAYTIGVRFFNDNTLLPGAKVYTYVTNIPGCKVGQLVVVPVTDTTTFKLAIIACVDEDVDIEPGDTTEYKWVVTKVDVTAYLDLLDRNSKIAKAVLKLHKRNVRETFRREIGMSLPDEVKALL